MNNLNQIILEGDVVNVSEAKELTFPKVEFTIASKRYFKTEYGANEETFHF